MKYMAIELSNYIPASKASVYLYLLDISQEISISERPMVL